jgi:hypothetical protein
MPAADKAAPLPGSPAWLNQDNPPPAVPPEDAALLTFLRALRERQQAEAAAEALVRSLQDAAKTLDGWRRAAPAAVPAVPGKHVVEAGLQTWRAARERELAAWKALPSEWQAPLDRLRPG